MTSNGEAFLSAARVNGPKWLAAPTNGQPGYTWNHVANQLLSIVQRHLHKQGGESEDCSAPMSRDGGPAFRAELMSRCEQASDACLDGLTVEELRAELRAAHSKIRSLEVVVAECEHTIPSSPSAMPVSQEGTKHENKDQEPSTSSQKDEVDFSFFE